MGQWAKRGCTFAISGLSLCFFVFPKLGQIFWEMRFGTANLCFGCFFQTWAYFVGNGVSDFLGISAPFLGISGNLRKKRPPRHKLLLGGPGESPEISGKTFPKKPGRFPKKPHNSQKCKNLILNKSRTISPKCRNPKSETFWGKKTSEMH